MTRLPPEPLSEQQIEEALRQARAILTAEEGWRAGTLRADTHLAALDDNAVPVARALLALQARLRESEEDRAAWRQSRETNRETAQIAIRRAVAAEQEAGRLRELAKRAKSQAAAPDYDEEAIRDALWAVVDAAFAPEAQA